MKTIIQLETLTCPSCVKRIEGALSKQQGVKEVSVKFNASKVEIIHDEALINHEALGSLIESIGYTVLNRK